MSQRTSNHPTSPSALGLPSALPSRAVLVIDDDEPFRAALCDLLAQRGLVVHGAADAYEAAHALKERTFDAVFSDIKMPGGGFLVLQRVRQMQPRTPVILVTGSPSEDWTNRAKAEGAFAYLVKPVGKEQILDVLRRAFERSRFALRPRDGNGSPAAMR